MAYLLDQLHKQTSQSISYNEHVGRPMSGLLLCHTQANGEVISDICQTSDVPIHNFPEI